MLGVFRKKVSNDIQKVDLKNLEGYFGSVELGLEVYERYEKACLAGRKEIMISLDVQIFRSEYEDSICKFFVLTYDVYPGTVSSGDQEAFEALYRKVLPCDNSWEVHYEGTRQLIGLSYTNAEKVLDAAIERFNNSHPCCQLIKKSPGHYSRSVNGM